MISEKEQIYYAELFQSCDVDGTGKFSGGHVFDLFRSSGLSQELLLQITQLCGAKRLGHFGRSQFYIALKLIAAAQCGLPVTLDSINLGVDIPLPKFHKSHNSEPGVTHQMPVMDNISSQEKLQLQGQLPPPPGPSKKSHGRNLSGQFWGLQPDGVSHTMPVQTPIVKEEQMPTDATASPFSPTQPQMVAPPNIPLSASQSPPICISPHNVTNFGPKLQSSVPPTVSNYPVLPQNFPVHAAVQHLKPTALTGQQLKDSEEWARFESDDEKYGLLGQVMKEDWSNMKLPDRESSSYSSDTDSVEDVWSINDEQREYYMKQFQNIEPDSNGHISGTVAKEFFEKSKLSNHELSKIWNLADLNKDGALSLEEFCIAMHLVVLRRNEIEIPDKLPFSLMPYNAFTNEDSEPFAADLPQGSTLKRASPLTPPVSLWNRAPVPELPESPHISSSNVASPSLTPANFDFQKPDTSDTEAHIVQPKARRLSLEIMLDISEARPEREPPPSSDDGVLYAKERTTPVKKHSSLTTSTAEHNSIDVNAAAAMQGRPRPHSKKSTGTIQGHILPPVLLSSQISMESGDRNLPATIGLDTVHEPPAPPPRPGQHGRSMSLDYPAPPAVPPRSTTKDPPGNASKLVQFKHVEPIQSQEVSNIIPGSNAMTTIIPVDTDTSHRLLPVDHKQAGGGHDFNKTEPKTAVAWDLLGDDFDDGSAERQAEFVLAAQRQANRDKKELQMAIRTHKERNSTLTRLNSELNQELQEVMEQRIALEIQLEHLRPYSS